MPSTETESITHGPVPSGDWLSKVIPSNVRSPTGFASQCAWYCVACTIGKLATLNNQAPSGSANTNRTVVITVPKPQAKTATGASGQ